MYACREGFYDIVEFLIESGTKLNMRSKQNKKVLEYAATEEIAELVECCMMCSP